MAKHIYTYVNPTAERDLAEACRVLADDGVLAYPTDVNWAFGCDAASPKAIARLKALKPEHPKDQPFTLLCHSIAMISEVGFLDSFAYRLLKKALPGPYTLLLQRNRNLPKQIKDKRPVVGVRLPASPLLLDLVARYGKPLLTTSLPAPHPEQGPLRYGYEVDERYGHALDLILDLGEEVVPRLTTIIDLSEGDCRVVREGVGDVSLFQT